VLPLNRAVLILATVVGVLVAGVTADYWARCHGKPLTRDEALRRSKVRLERFAKSFGTGATLPALIDGRYEEDTKSWAFTYKNADCTVAIIVDRCHGDEVGGAAGCGNKSN